MSKKFPLVKRLDEAGRFLLCSDIRKIYGFEPNKEVLIYLEDDGIFVKPMPKDDEEKTD